MPPPSSSITLLDGSIGHTLKARGVIPPDATFLAVADLAASDNPAPLSALAREYAAAGCSILTSPNFGVTPTTLARAGRPDADLEALTSACVAAVRTEGATVAGCLPPLGPDCYAPAPPEVAVTAPAVYERIASALLASGVDLLLAETVSSSADAAAAFTGATAAAAAASTATVPLWVAWTLEDGAWPPKLRGGEYLADAAASLMATEARRRRAGEEEAQGSNSSPPPLSIAAHLINCCTPASVTAGIAVLRAVLPPGVAVGGYANGFARTTTAWLEGKEKDKDGLIMPAAYASAAAEWVDSGATILGGCCGVGPDHLRAVAGLLGKD